MFSRKLTNILAYDAPNTCAAGHLSGSPGVFRSSCLEWLADKNKPSGPTSDSFGAKGCYVYDLIMLCVLCVGRCKVSNLLILAWDVEYRVSNGFLQKSGKL